jgi:hypothetical protein
MQGSFSLPKSWMVLVICLLIDPQRYIHVVDGAKNHQKSIKLHFDAALMILGQNPIFLKDTKEEKVLDKTGKNHQNVRMHFDPALMTDQDAEDIRRENLLMGFKECSGDNRLSDCKEKDLEILDLNKKLKELAYHGDQCETQKDIESSKSIESERERERESRIQENKLADLNERYETLKKVDSTKTAMQKKNVDDLNAIFEALKKENKATLVENRALIGIADSLKEKIKKHQILPSG